MEIPQKRCKWAGKGGSLMEQYHDEEWGSPCHNEKRLFEMLILEGMQAGLSWAIVLNKRENMRKAFDDFSAEKIAKYGQEKLAELLQNEGIIRNRRKLEALVSNAEAYLKLKETHGGLDTFMWAYVNGKPIMNHWQQDGDMPASTPLSDCISKDLKKLGFRFVGSTIIYSYMQAIGMVNDHVKGCYLYGGDEQIGTVED